MLWRPFYPIVAFRKASISRQQHILCTVCTFYMDEYVYWWPEPLTQCSQWVLFRVQYILSVLNVDGLLCRIMYIDWAKKKIKKKRKPTKMTRIHSIHGEKKKNSLFTGEKIGIKHSANSQCSHFSHTIFQLWPEKKREKKYD